MTASAVTGEDAKTGGDAMQEFAITDPLPSGTMLLEASAGTGKTWTIAALVTRYVAEGVALLEQMLVVTFSRAASQERAGREVDAQLLRQLDGIDAERRRVERQIAANRTEIETVNAAFASRRERLAQLLPD